MNYGTLLCAPLLLLTAAAASAAPSFHCRFARGEWKPEEWIPAKLPDWPPGVQWVQEEECLRNDTPKGAAPEELQGKRVAETRVSMVYCEPVQGDATVSATMDFSPTMAPLIVLAGALGESNEKGLKQYEGCFEIVLFNEGVNVWQHFWEDGKPRYELAAYARFPLQANTRYRLDVRRKGRELRVSVAGHTFGFLTHGLPERLYAGITACEGVNRFYDFTLGPAGK